MSSEVQPSPNETVTLSKNLMINISVAAIAVGIILLFMSWQFDMMNSNTKMQLDMMNYNTKMELEAIKSQVSSLNFRYDALGTAALIVAGVFAILGNFAKVSDWITEQLTMTEKEEKKQMKNKNENRTWW